MYYAAYLATAHVAQERRIAFTAAKEYYQHDTLPDVARGNEILDGGRAAQLRYLYDMGVKADYSEDTVELEEADQCARLVDAIVRHLLEARS